MITFINGCLGRSLTASVSLLFVFFLVSCGVDNSGQVRQLIDDQQYDEAIALLTETIKEEPDDGEARLAMAEVLLLTNKFYQAEKHLQQLRRIDQSEGTRFQRRVGPLIMRLVRLEVYWQFGEIADSLLQSPAERNSPHLKTEGGGQLQVDRAIELMRMAQRHDYESSEEASEITFTLAKVMFERKSFKTALKLISHTARNQLMRSEVTGFLLEELQKRADSGELFTSGSVWVKVGNLAIKTKPKVRKKVGKLFFNGAKQHLRKGKLPVSEILKEGFEPAVTFDSSLQKAVVKQLSDFAKQSKTLSGRAVTVYTLGKYQQSSGKRLANTLIALSKRLYGKAQYVDAVKSIGYAVKLDPALWRKGRGAAFTLDPGARGKASPEKDIWLLLNFYTFHVDKSASKRQSAYKLVKKTAEYSPLARHMLKNMKTSMRLTL